MLQFRNDTPFEGLIVPLPDRDGVDALFTVVKATFAVGSELSVADEQVPVALEATYLGDPARSGIVAPSDLSLMKPGTDVLLVGHAHAPGGRPTAQMDVSLRVGPISKRVRVYGDRTWKFGVAMSRPEPFDAMPLVWERAYGGVDERGRKPRGEARNPVGVGFVNAEADDESGEVWLPNLEDPSHPITTWRQSQSPTCFAPIAPHWEPRCQYAGTYDEHWQRTRAPWLPDDFDPRFLQNAPADQVVDGYLEGGETVEVDGASPRGMLRFRLPILDLEITYLVDDSPVAVPAVLDTLLLEPDLDRFQMVWRAALSCDKRTLRVNEVHVALGA